MEENSLETRVALLEKELEKEKKSLSSRYGLWAGLLALTISIASSVWGVVDRINEAIVTKSEQIFQANQIISDMSEAHAEAVMLQSELGAVRFQPVGSAFAARMVGYFNRLDDFDDVILASVDTAELINVSEYAMLYRDPSIARSYARHAINSADSDFLLSIAHKQLGRAQILDKSKPQISKGTEAHHTALEYARKSAGIDQLGLIFNTHISLISSLAIVGACLEASQQIEQMEAEFEPVDTPAGKAFRESALEELRPNTNCQI
jgi:hypothetical protein